MNWSERFAAYLAKRDISQLDVVIELRTYGVRATQSQVHYWIHGSRPRSEARDRIAKWSKGDVPASAPRSEAKSTSCTMAVALDSGNAARPRKLLSVTPVTYPANAPVRTERGSR